MSDEGVLYILGNSDQSLAKVGMTRNGTPDTRADDYSRQHGIQWHTYWSARTQNVAAADAAAHRDLADRRFALTPEAQEIFHTTPAHAQRIAARYVVPPDGDARPELRLAPPAWRQHLERITAAVLLLAACWAALRRLWRTLRRLHAALR